MNILFLLIPLSLLLLSFAIWAFFWAVKNDQFDDLEGPAYSILFDDEDEKSANQKKTGTNQPAAAPTSKPDTPPDP